MLLEEPSKIHQQIQAHYACISVGCHWQDIEMESSFPFGNYGISWPMFAQPVLHSFGGKYTNMTKLWTSEVKHDLFDHGKDRLTAVLQIKQKHDGIQ